MKASRFLEQCQSVVDRMNRRIANTRFFEEDRKAFYVISCGGRYSGSSDTVIAQVIGYNKESVVVRFLAGEGSTAHELATRRWRQLSRSIKFDGITDVKRVEKKDLPMYLGMQYTSPEIEKALKNS